MVGRLSTSMSQLVVWPLGSVRLFNVRFFVIGVFGLVAERVGNGCQAPVSVVYIAPHMALAVFVRSQVELVVDVLVGGAVGISRLGQPVGGIVGVVDRPAFGIGVSGDAI